ncbi:hypothetical protein SNE40_004486 [Patella caerulea]|uniref:Uncharacterized protein n=1 Tax=Patella caerulea TaxID=87958 RepID=A0AAN8PX90_PATCE
MTLKDDMENANKELQIPTGIGSCVKQCIADAAVDNRLKIGVLECAALLKCNADNVMLCVLPDAGSENISVNIQHTLIEAFCRENDIKILKIDSFSKILVTKGDGYYGKHINNDYKTVTSDLSCLLIEYPNEKLSRVDEVILQYHQKLLQTNKHSTKPIIHIPE